MAAASFGFWIQAGAATDAESPSEQLPLAGIVPLGHPEDITLTGEGAVQCGSAGPLVKRWEDVVTNSSARRAAALTIYSLRCPSHPPGQSESWALGIWRPL